MCGHICDNALLFHFTVKVELKIIKSVVASSKSNMAGGGCYAYGA